MYNLTFNVMSQPLVFPITESEQYLGESRQGKYIKSYLEKLGARTCILEKPYIDKDFAIEYQLFYSRSFFPYSKETTRIHFFSKDFTYDDFKLALESQIEAFISEFQESYLGFSVIKPIPDKDGNFIIGRTLLATYPSEDNRKKRIYLKTKQKASLFGINLSIESIPFQAQDNGVSACATIALWTALQSITDVFGIPKLSPAEVTETSAILPFTGRTFPQTGLYPEQMIDCIRSLNLDVEILDLENRDNDNFLTTAIKAFIAMDVPLIILLKMTMENESPGFHAAVVTGYQCDKDENVTELYIHDDQIGPYSRVKPDPTTNSFNKWSNEWSDEGYEVIPLMALIPVYHKIRQDFAQMYAHLESMKELLYERLGAEAEETNLNIRLYLQSVQTYKSYISRKIIDNKIEILFNHLPRYLWVLRYSLNEVILFDEIYDGTEVYPKLLTGILYSQ